MMSKRPELPFARKKRIRISIVHFKRWVKNLISHWHHGQFGFGNICQASDTYEEHKSEFSEYEKHTLCEGD